MKKRQNIDTYREYYEIVKENPKIAYKSINNYIKENNINEENELYHFLNVLKGVSLINLGYLRLAAKLFNLSLLYFENNNNLIFIEACYSNLALCFMQLKDYNNSIYLYNKLYELYDSKNDVENKIEVKLCLFSFYFTSYGYEKYSIQDILDIIGHYKDKEHYYKSVAIFHLAVYYRNKKKYELFIDNITYLKQYFKRTKYFSFLQAVYLNEAIYYIEICEFKKALSCLESSLDFFKYNGIAYYLDEIYNKMIEVFKKEKKLEKIIEYQNLLHELEKKKIIEYGLYKSNDYIAYYKSINLKNSLSYAFHQEYSLFKLKLHKVIIEDYKGNVYSINLEDIISVTSKKTHLLIFLTNERILYSSQKLGELYTYLSNFSNSIIFFKTNVKNEFVNLYWFGEYVSNKRILKINVMGKEYYYTLSFRQIKEFNQIIHKINL